LESLAVPELDCRVWGAGYRSMDCPALLKDFRAEGRETYQLGVLHGDPLVPSSPYCPVTSAQVRASGLTYLALGHIHKSGSFSAGETLCGWPGCPMGRGFDETGEKGVYLVEIGEKTELRFVPLDTPRFYDLEADMDRRAVEELLPGAGSDDFYRVTLTGSVGTPLPQLGEMLSRFPNLELIDRRQAPTDPWENLDEDTLEGTYLRLLQRKLEGADPRREELIALAAEISRKILEGKEVIL